MKKHLFLALCIGLTLVSCGGDNESGTTRLQVALIDAPGDYQEVNIDIHDVQINYGTDEEGWTSLTTVESGIYDILDLTNGVEAVLANVEVPSGRLSQIRLVLGTDNSIMIDGQSIDLNTPSAQQSGLKLNVNADLVEGVDYKMLLDFDAARSIVKAGNSGKYNLKPTIRVIAEAQSGSIKGIVDPSSFSSAIIAVINQDSISTYTDDQGMFLLQGVAPGTYDVSVVPEETSGYEPKELGGIEVILGEQNDMGTIVLDN
ncbi:MAG: DUF4382 domain-containing protein [Cyclobacteriaceae bacterium]